MVQGTYRGRKAWKRLSAVKDTRHIDYPIAIAYRARTSIPIDTGPSWVWRREPFSNESDSACVDSERNVALRAPVLVPTVSRVQPWRQRYGPLGRSWFRTRLIPRNSRLSRNWHPHPLRQPTASTPDSTNKGLKPWEPFSSRRTFGTWWMTGTDRGWMLSCALCCAVSVSVWARAPHCPCFGGEFIKMEPGRLDS